MTHPNQENPNVPAPTGHLNREDASQDATTLGDTAANSASSATDAFEWGHLHVREMIGEGTFGEVYRAFDPTLELYVALKLRKVDAELGNEDLRENFLSEARRLARVRHPNIIRVHGADVHNGRMGIWTELLHGKTLEKYLAEVGPISAREAAIIGLDLCRALSAVHAAGLLHRDIKTANVIREVGGRIVLMDFGSMAALPLAGNPHLTQHVQGTPSFMPPEQLRGEITGPPTDIYALGVVLYRLVTRALPIEANSIVELVEKHQRMERVPLRQRRPDLPTDFVRVVETATAASANDRFPSAGALELALAETLDSRARRRRGPALAIAAVLSVIAGVVLWQALDRGENSKSTTSSVERPALAASASLYRRSHPSDEPLFPGEDVAVGDRLFLSLQSAESMYVYVLNEDDTGDIFVLFPLRGITPSNPLAPGARHRLPGESGDSLYYWTVTSAGQRESIIAIASREPLPALEREIEQFPRAAAGQPPVYGKVGVSTVETLRGMGGLSAEPRTKPVGRARLSEIFKEIALQGDRTGDIWTWQSQLRNPPEGGP